MSGALFVDLAPALSQRLQFWKYGGLGAMRGFIAMNIDRHPRDPGLDAVQSYVGLAFDFLRAFVR